jgi:hypothetical protein
MKKITVTRLDDGQWFGLTDDGDFLMLDRVPKGTSSGDIIDLEEDELTKRRLAYSDTPKRVKQFPYKRYFTVAAAIMLLFMSSFFQLFNQSAEASMITFYGQKEWTIEVKEDGKLIDVATGKEFDVSDKEYILEQLASIGSEEQNLWAGIENEEENPHVNTLLESLTEDLERNQITLYSFSFNQKWWKIKHEKDLTIKELFQLYIEDQYKVSPNDDNLDAWMEDLQKRFDIFENKK